MRQPIPAHNQLLAALPSSGMEHLFAALELVQMRVGDMVYGPGEQLQHAYFPTTAIVSLHYVTATGATCETSGVGHEGVVGVCLFMGGHSTASSAIVHTAGTAYRLQRRLLVQAFNGQAPMQRVLLAYVQALITQTAQTAVCNRHHSVEQQVCRWLLMTLDRMPSGELVLTQELMAGILGVRREGITLAAGKLQQAGLIRYRRGHLSVVDRSGLETRACECYAVVKNELGRLAKLPGH